MLSIYFSCLLSFILIIFAGCSSALKDTKYMASPEYQARPKITHSLIKAGEPFSEETIQKMLNGKIVMPKKISLAVIRLSDFNDGLDFQMIEENVAEKFYSKDNWGERVSALITVPQVLLSHPVTLAGLRHSAVLLQADALLIIKPISYSDWKFQWFDNNKAKGITSLEVMLMDTRTGMIPFTGIVTETAVIEKDTKDYSVDELLSRAKRESEAKALLKISPVMKEFFGSGRI